MLQGATVLNTGSTRAQKGVEAADDEPGATDGNGKKIGYLIREEDRADIENFIVNYPSIIKDYIPVAIIGEGIYLFIVALFYSFITGRDF